MLNFEWRIKSDVFALSVQAHTAQAEAKVPVVLDSLQGSHLVLSLRKRPGKEDVDVLDAPVSTAGQHRLPQCLHVLLPGV